VMYYDTYEKTTISNSNYTRKNQKSNRHSNCNNHLPLYIYLTVLLHNFLSQQSKITHTISTAPSSDTPLPPMDALPAHPPLLPLTMNTTPPPNKAPQKIKTKKLHLPHPCNLDVFPSPTNKWSATTHPIKAWVVGYLGFYISYKHFYFNQCRVFLTKAFATSTTASTVGGGGTPRGSTELDAICGFNCAMDTDEFHMFAQLVLGLCPAKQHGTKPSKRSLLNMLLEDFVLISNLTAVFALDEPDNRRTLAHRLARFSLLLLGADALTPKIVARVWGKTTWFDET
jgi:hypothetical protein